MNGRDVQKHGRPPDNQRQNRQVRDAAQSVGLDREQRRTFGRLVEVESRRLGANLSFEDLCEIAREVRDDG